MPTFSDKERPKTQMDSNDVKIGNQGGGGSLYSLGSGSSSLEAKPKGLAKVWREIKRPFRRLLTQLSRLRWRIQSRRIGLTRQEYERCKSLPELYIRLDGRVNIPYFEIDIALGCNLRCQHCTHFSPYRKGYVPTEQIVHWFETWSKKIRPVRMNLLGGEPFLHPDLPAVLLETRRIWKDSTLGIVSNGLLIPQASQKVFDALKRANFHVVISDHSDSTLSYEKVVAGCVRLEENGISHELRASNEQWWVQHQWDEHGAFVPFQSDPRDAWSICISKGCPSLANNRFYKCAVLASVVEGVGEGALPSEHWKDFLTCSSLSPDANALTILKYFCTQEVQECSQCPDKIIITEARQMPPLPAGQKAA